MADVATLAEFKDWLRWNGGTAEDVKLQMVLSAASEWVEWRIGGPLADTVITERQRTNGRAIVTRRQPLISVTSITPDLGTTLDPSWYTVDTDTNMIRFYWGVRASWVTIVYHAGLTTIPYRVKGAGLELARHLWLTQNGSSGRGRSDDDTPVPMGFAVPRRVEEMLAPTPLIGFA